MTFRQLNRQVLRGESGGRIIWQPRIGAWLADKLFENAELPGRFRGMRTLHELYAALGCSSRNYEFGACVVRKEHPDVAVTRRELSSSVTELRIHTPAGEQRILLQKTATSRRAHVLKREVETEADLKVAIWRENNCAWEWSQAEYERLENQWGDFGVPSFTVTATPYGYYGPRTNIEELFVSRMGVEQTIYALCDYPARVDEFVEASNRNWDRLIELLCASPIEHVNFGDNIHAGTLPPSLFLKYIMPEYRRRAERLHRAGKFVSAHFDGHVKPLLPYLKETGLDGIEAITPVPQGDVTLDEVKTALGDRMFLLDGIPAILFDRTFATSELEECAKRVIDLFAPKLVLGISDEISSSGDIERLQRVGEIVEGYNARQGLS